MANHCIKVGGGKGGLGGVFLVVVVLQRSGVILECAQELLPAVLQGPLRGNQVCCVQANTLPAMLSNRSGPMEAVFIRTVSEGNATIFND